MRVTSTQDVNNILCEDTMWRTIGFVSVLRGNVNLILLDGRLTYVCAYFSYTGGLYDGSKGNQTNCLMNIYKY